MTGDILANAYRIIELIGTGGMSDVYRAEQLFPPKRVVAIKVLKDEYEADAAFVRRFAQEARAALDLIHENIVRSYDVGMDGEKRFIVLEYVEGKTLKQLIREESGGLPIDRAVRLGIQVLDALAHAHGKGIVHRDVKPQNIIVTADGRARLADFGIARLTAADTTQTFTGGGVLGSVHYLSPEQARGESVSVESDIYSMGVTLYEMVTGSVPFDAETSVSVAIKHLHDKPEAPISRRADLPPALNDVILKALQKDAPRRYHSAKAMRHDLARVLSDPAGRYARVKAERPERPKRRGRGALRLALLAIALIGIFVVAMLSGQPRGAVNAVGAGLVPVLEGKTIEEASGIADLRGYAITVTETVHSEQHEPGYVVSQYPLAGTSLKNGGSIQVTVSGGDASVPVPNLAGMTLAEAQETLAGTGLAVGNVEYRDADAPAGAIIQQNPAANSLATDGDEVDIYISGEPVTISLEAPDVVSLPLAEAMSVLQTVGFSNFRVYLDAPEDNAAAYTVIRQNPAVGELFALAGKFELTICAKALYALDWAATLDIPADGSSVRAVIAREVNGIPYEQVVFEAELDAGEQEISFTAASDEGGEFNLLLYLNGTQVRQTAVIFSYRG
ncbi:MAG: protein kinase [Clostridiales bacterium]|jgi:serine/threonine-protein kinase|nr:protein kinase [Clostridiales bacterium]